MPSKMDIGNQVLGLLGVTQQIADLDNPTNDAEKQLNLWWDDCVKEILERHDWKFARGHAALASTTAPSEEYDYAYQMPNDCLAARYLWDVDAKKRITDSEYEVSGRTICTSLESAYLVYTKNTEVVGNYPAFFVKALRYLLASYMAPKFGDKASKSDEMLEKYEKAIFKAIEIDCSQNNYPDTGEDQWLSAGGYSESIDSDSIVWVDA